MWNVILDAVLDTLKIFPFLLVIYIIIELLENKMSFTRNKKLLQGGLAPLCGAATGLIPQCGFSVMAAKLYDKSLIRTGTVLAVFLATSDEAVIILLSSGWAAPEKLLAVLPLIGIKLVIALAAGYLANFICRKEVLAEPAPEEEIDGYSCGHEHDGKKKVMVYFVSPLLHSLKIAAYILAVNLIFGFIVWGVGEDKLAEFLSGSIYLQPLLTSLVGLIPNCASSIIITQTFVSGNIAFGSLVAGLCANAGLGFVILLKNPKKIKRNLLLLLALYIISVAAGLAINAIADAANFV